MQKPLGSRQQAGVDGPGTECLSDVGHRTTHRGQEGHPAIVEQMPPVRDLHCIRKSPGNGAGVTAIAVAGHDFYPGVAVQSGFDRGRFAVGKNVDDPPPFQIADQGSIPPTASQNPLARGLPMSWQLADVEDEGWARQDVFMRPVDQENRFLIVTEGSSDATIIRHALNLLKLHVADFFDFVDMNEGYPFTGTGNLYNFTKGLIGISVQNNVVILYDNDAEGVFSFNRTVKLNVPNNIRILKLPDLPVFRDFETIGPSGAHRADINGRAAAIECYLDAGPGAAVRWKNHHKKLDVYHGELVAKGDVMKEFLAQSKVNGDYDFSRIAAVVDMITSECTAIRESARLAALEAS